MQKRMDLTPGGNGRMAIALGLIAFLAVAVRFTMEPGRYRDLTWILLGFFAVRVVLGRLRSG